MRTARDEGAAGGRPESRAGPTSRRVVLVLVAAGLACRAPPPGYSVLSGTGRWLGHLTLPPGFGVRAIGGDRVVGVVSDALDVQAVAVYRLARDSA